MAPARTAMVVLLFAAVAAGDTPAADAAACKPSSSTVQVLAVGDSLTNGAVPSENRYYPYTRRLGQLMGAELGRPISMKTAGANGAGTVVGGVQPADKGIKLPQLLDNKLAEGPRPDVTIIMGGVNDLGFGNQTAATVFGNLKAMYERAARGTSYAVVAIAPWANRFVARSSDNEAQRVQLVAMLQAFFGALRAAGPPVMLLDSIESGPFRFWDMPQDQVKALQDDMLHLTAAGYDRLGEHVLATLRDAGVLADIKCGVPRKPLVPGPSPNVKRTRALPPPGGPDVRLEQGPVNASQAPAAGAAPPGAPATSAAVRRARLGTSTAGAIAAATAAVLAAVVL